ncbi:DUF1203 domain-containing protein [Novosphingobium sp. P6W]|uniref:DUF1203 domain-containing protein n=1 Tax=Novosphingobium sp. P6W TaxID=1609758 RepID=UPI0005C2E126|nr:DUF1203 domain-containing protein [Novosphingobium sp. P6W]AXB76448.1 DUF1203 domain-containing protein [Novosphingobium sp. P6W]KIS32051.1 hypothetical protein TQ38_12810 [Novosphingobium sp. P6W]
MAYRIAGLPRGGFAQYYGKTAEELGHMGARRVLADADRGFPCRVSLEDARAGESLILLNFTSHDVANPYRSAYAIYIREHADQAQDFVDRLPPVFSGRALSLRGFDGDGMLHAASLAAPDEADDAIRALLAMPQVACIHAHNAAYGCFAARIERHGDGL